jgi:hypothetical protein
VRRPFLHGAFAPGQQAGSRPTVVGNGEPMDIVVAAIILSLAALGFVWLRFVERA